MAEPTKSQLKSDINKSANDIEKVTADTLAQQQGTDGAGGVRGATQELSNLAKAMTLTDAKEIIQATRDFKNDKSKTLGVDVLDKHIKNYGGGFIDEAKRLLFQVDRTPTSFGVEAIYGEGQNIMNASMVNDPTYTSIDMATLGQISSTTEAKGKAMYKERQGELAASQPVYKPLSNDPSTNQMVLGMAMQGAAGLLSLIDPEASAAAAAEIGMKTIDAVYARKQSIDQTNKELYEKYLEAYGKHTTRSDANWKTYYDSIMKERSELKTVMQKQLDDEYKGLADKTKTNADILNKKIEALVKDGKMSEERGKYEIDKLEKSAKIKLDLLKEMNDTEDKAQSRAFLYFNAHQNKINKWLENLAPAMSSKDWETNGLTHANSYLGEMQAFTTVDQVREGTSGMDAATQDPELLAFEDKFNQKMAALDPNADNYEDELNKLQAEAIDYSRNIVLTSDANAQSREFKAGYKGLIFGKMQKKVETIVNMKRAKKTGEQAIELAAVKGAISEETAMKKLEAQEIPAAKKAILAGKTERQIKAKLTQYVGEEIANRDDLTLDEKLKLAGD